MTFKQIYTLQPSIKQDFHHNLDFILKYLQNAREGSIVLAPELALSGYCYQRMQEASDFSRLATERLLASCADKTLIATMIEKNGNHFYNNLKVFHRGEVIHKQAKSKLFSLGDEHLHFAKGDEGECVPFFIDGIKCAALICFELRFTPMWQRLEDAQIVFVPALWGKERKQHFETLARALAIANQCYVIASDPSNLQMAKGSSIITPFGLVHKNDNKECIELEINLKEVTHVRKSIQTRFCEL